MDGYKRVARLGSKGNWIWEIKHEEQGIIIPAAGKAEQKAGTTQENPGKHKQKRRGYSAFCQFSEHAQEYAAWNRVGAQPQYQCGGMQPEKLQKMGIRSEERDIIRGALLHDYFLYDWHHHTHKKGWKNLHGFTHPETALNNARKEYHLSPREQDIIKKHMWPLTVVPPRCREAWIVTAADKYCSLLETVGPRLELFKGLGRHWTALPRRIRVTVKREPQKNSGQEANGRNTSAIN